jgi:hypothetical protein
MLAVVFFGSKESDRNGTQGQEEAGWQAALFNTWEWKQGLLTMLKYCEGRPCFHCFCFKIETIRRNLSAP